MTDPRIVDLELRFIKLERFVHELSEVVAEQGKAIDALALEMRRMRERLGDTGGGPPGGGDEAERPPHY